MRIFAPEPRAPRAPLSASPDDVFLGALLVGSQTLVGLLDRSKEHEVLFPPSGGPFRPFRSSRQVIDSMLSDVGRALCGSMGGAAAENT